LIKKGNKCDLSSQREIPYHIGESFAQRNNMRFIETSAKDSQNVEEIFLEIANTLTKQANETLVNNKKQTVNLNPNTSKINNSSSCC
jgi:GTPase SAR1 family protein